MDFPKGILALSFFFFFYVLLQIFLFLRFRDYLNDRLQHEGKRALICDLVASSFIITISPVAGHIFFGWDFHERSPRASRILFSAFDTWAFGSGGCAVILAGCDFYR